MKDVFYFEMDGQKHEYHVKDDVAFGDLLNAMQSGFDMCFADDGSYHPELFEFAKEYIILATLTDIEMPDDANSVYRIIRAIDGVRSVDADFIADGMREKAAMHEKLLVTTVQNYHTQRIADMMEAITAKITEAADTISSLLNELGNQMEGSDLGDVQQLLTALAEVKGMSPEDLVSGMLAYNKAQKKTTKKKTAKKVAAE